MTRFKVTLTGLLVAMALLTIGARADDPAPDDAIGAITWKGTTFVPKNLGSLKLDEKTFAKTTVAPRGMAFQSNGNLLTTFGNGCAFDMGITEWTGTRPATWVKFQLNQYSQADFKNADKMKELAEGELHGNFWFFAGPLAVDGRDETYFNLGACGPNGLYHLLQVDPIKVKQVFSSDAAYALQFYPDSSRKLYTTCYWGIRKVDLGKPISPGDSEQFFSMQEKNIYVSNALLIDEDHLLVTLLLNVSKAGDREEEKRTPPKFMAVAFDRKAKGYYVMDIKNWGPMAIRPTDHACFRFDVDAMEIRQFTPPVFPDDGDAPSITVSEPADLSAHSSKASLTAGDIFRKARETYAALTSYVDEGKTVASVNGLTITTTFNIKMARPNLYRINWIQSNDSAYATTTTKLQSVWSAGDGDFLDMLGRGPKKQKNQEMALSGATGISAGAAATVPSAFFKLHWGDQLGNAERIDKQQADQTIGDADCYVFAGSLKGRTSTIWIGKADFLIHQVRTVTSAAATKEAMDEAARMSPDVAAHRFHIDPQEITSTETHTNIVVNEKLTASDFAR